MSSFQALSCTNLRLIQLSWDTVNSKGNEDMYSAKNTMLNILPQNSDESVVEMKHGDYTYTIIDDINSLPDDGFLNDQRSSVLETYESLEVSPNPNGVVVKVKYYDDVYERDAFSFISYKRYDDVCQWVGISAPYLADEK